MEQMTPRENADRLIVDLGYEDAAVYATEQEEAWMRHAERVGYPGLPDIRYWYDVRHEVEQAMARGGDPEPRNAATRTSAESQAFIDGWTEA